MKLLYTGPLVNAELMVVMLEKHGIAAAQEFADTSEPDDSDLNRETNVLVPDSDHARARRLFYEDKENEI